MKLLISLILSLNLSSSVFEEVKMQYENIDRSYLVYYPKNEDIKNPVNLFIGLHGYTGTASGFEKETTGGFNNMADKYNFISVYPQGLFFKNTNDPSYPFVSSWNDLAGSKTRTPTGEICSLDADKYPKYPNCNGGRCAWTSCNDDLGFIKAVIDKLKETNNIKDIYVLGMSNGGMMAQALACKYPSMFKVVVNIVGMQHQGLSCIPSDPINFIFYGGEKDKVVPPINVKADDGYFYEPISKSFNEWSNKFQCESFNSNNFFFHDKFTKNVASDCIEGVKVISILNHDRGHLWPGLSSSGGYCSTVSQTSLNLTPCSNDSKNLWGNEFILDIIFNL